MLQEERDIAKKALFTQLRVRGQTQECQQVVDMMRSLDLLSIKEDMSQVDSLVNLMANQLVLQLNKALEAI